MRTVGMCFSLLNFPRCKIHTLANSWRGNLYESSRSSAVSCSYRVLCSDQYEQGGLDHRKKWTRKSINTNVGGTNESLTSKISKSNTCKLGSTGIEERQVLSIRKKIVSGDTSTEIITSTKLETTTEIRSDQYYIELAKLATIICFDIETTGFSRTNDRIIEIALQDLRGGEKSTFQSLVNPGMSVPNEHIHGISEDMVNRSDVPRMRQLIPILVDYVRSRQLPGGIVVLVAHNARNFDVPFLKNEFSRSSHEIPSDWLFADTMPLARKLMKIKDIKQKSNLQALREYYAIPLIGSAHRALSDVHVLALVLQRLTYDLKLPVSGLIQASFK